MRATTLLCAFAAIGCSEAQPPAPAPVPPPPNQANGHRNQEPRTREECQRYQYTTDFFGYCLYQVAQRGEGDITAERLCEGAGSWTNECRNAWATARGDKFHRWELEPLLEACTSDDCRFEVLDFRAHPSVSTQIERCRQHTGRFGGDCAAHAMDRWLKASPTLEEVDALAATTLYADRVGYYIALASGCLSLGECRGSEAVTQRCLQVIEDLRRPDNNLCVQLRR